MTADNIVPAAVIGGRPGASGGPRTISDATPTPPGFVADGTSGSRGVPPTLGCRDAKS